MKQINQLIVIGNGFDLQCGLKSQYKDFFEDYFQISSDNDDHTVAEMKNLLLDGIKDDTTIEKLKNAYMEICKGKNRKTLSTWDVIFLALFICFSADNHSLYWCDVETIIYFVITWWFIESPKAKGKTKDNSIYSVSIDQDIYYKTAFKNYLINSNIIKDGIKNEKIAEFKSIIESAIVDKNEVDILKELNIFEDEFASYIAKQVKLNKDLTYLEKSTDLIDKIIAVDTRRCADESVNLDVLSFNYSLDEEYISDIKDKTNDPDHVNIHSWTNIHGIAAYKSPDKIKKINELHGVDGSNNYFQLPAPIFGIDNHDIMKESKTRDDPRLIFTKAFRLMDNHVNVVRSEKFQNNVDIITFYGHSLSNADYSYFESIFDQYDVFHSNVKLEFYYYKGNSEKEAKKNERQVMKQVVNLLTSYGSTLKNEHGENIINKMMLEQRLQIIPNP